MEDTSPERLGRRLTRLETARQLSETAGLVLDAANRELWRKNKELEHQLTRPEHPTNE